MVAETSRPAAARDGRTEPFKVALVGLDGQTPPGWVATGLEQAGITFVVDECTSREALAALAGDADIVWVFGSHQCLYAENFDVIPRCGAIIRTGSGTDNIPVDLATERGIVVANTPDANTDTVSDHAIGLLFSVIRQIPRQDHAVHTGVWDRYLAWPRWHLHDQTLGLIGFGRIARAVTHKLSGFRLTVLAYDPLVAPEIVAAHGARFVALDELLGASDFVSIHCPLEPGTRHLIDERALRQMKRSAILINTARGTIIDEAALVRALREGWIAAAGLDVLEAEPPAKDHPLLGLDNVVLTPHIAGYSDEYLDNSWRLSMEVAIDLANGRRPRSVVNPSVQPRWNLQ